MHSSGKSEYFVGVNQLSNKEILGIPRHKLTRPAFMSTDEEKLKQGMLRLDHSTS